MLRIVTIVLVALQLACGFARPANTARPPNVLFLLTDDQRPDTIHALGNATIDTPHLDALVRAGTTFTRAVTAHPLCYPSRAEILTGCTGFTNGLPYGSGLNPKLVLWPEAMRRAGYHTCYTGKWHTPGKPTTRGYDLSRGLYAGGGGAENTPALDPRGRAITGYRGWVFQEDDGRKYPERGVGLTPDISRRFADAAIEFLTSRRAAKDERPFFLHVNFTAPHDPRLLPPGYETRYDPAKMTLPANFKPEHPFDHGNARGRDEVLLPFPRTPEDIRTELAVYYALISDLDSQVGRVLATLEVSGEAENTIVIYSSDHGLALGSHGLTGKQNMYEHTIGVPLVMRGPGIPKNVRNPAQCYLRDLYPTVCELAGVPVPDTVEATSVAPVLRGEKQQIHDAVVTYFADSQRAIRTDRFKLIRYPKINREQLFDVVNDPDELRNLASDPAHAATVAELRTRLAAWQRDQHDPLLTTGERRKGNGE